jgi:hypothetical protein
MQKEDAARRKLSRQVLRVCIFLRRENTLRRLFFWTAPKYVIHGATRQDKAPQRDV